MYQIIRAKFCLSFKKLPGRLGLEYCIFFKEVRALPQNKKKVTSSLLLFHDPFEPGVLVSVKVPSEDKKIYLKIICIWEKYLEPYNWANY